jgi:F-type H+-transporting ATPase subunit gamma
MATLRDIRNRIKSVRNTAQITRAMKMVSAAKLRRAQEMAVSGRPYSENLSAITRKLAILAGSSAHPLFRPSAGRKIDLVLFTSDKGLCGSFNANLIKKAQNFLEEHQGRVTLIPVGKKARDFAHRTGVPLGGEFTDITRSVGLPQAQRIAALLLRRIRSGEADTTTLINSRFVSVLTQIPTVNVLFPIRPAESDRVPEIEYLYEPSREALVEALVPLYTDTMVYQALVETVASEHGARMNAMETATKNAGELIARLTLYYNRARQAAITKELIEVVSGADALEG